MPVLKYVPEWIPGATFKKLARQWNVCLNSMVDKPYDLTKKQMADGVAPPSLVSNALENEASLTAQELHNIKWAAGSMYSGGADTVRSFPSMRRLMLTYCSSDCLRHLFDVPGHDSVP